VAEINFPYRPLLRETLFQLGLIAHHPSATNGEGDPYEVQAFESLRNQLVELDKETGIDRPIMGLLMRF